MTITKKCLCRSGKMFDIRTNRYEKCLHCNGTGIKSVSTENRCKYCGKPIETGYFCESCGKAFNEYQEEYDDFQKVV